MKKSLSLIAILLSLICTFTSCNDNTAEIFIDEYGYVVVNGVTTNIVADKDDIISVDADGYVVVNGIKTEYQVMSVVDDKIHYPLLNEDIKIESLPLVQQQKIDEYVADCKIIYTASYIGRLTSLHLEKPYVSFTDTFVYDFSKVDEDNLDERTSQLWDSIKALNNAESTPIMYIELSGYCNYYDDAYKVTSFTETSFIYGYFIFENETVKPYLYQHFVAQHYLLKLPDGTEIINCGNKYAEGMGKDKLSELYSKYQSCSSLNDVLKRLSFIED